MLSESYVSTNYVHFSFIFLLCNSFPCFCFLLFFAKLRVILSTGTSPNRYSLIFDILHQTGYILYVCVCLYMFVCVLCECREKHALFFSTSSVPTFFLYTLNIDLFDKLWYIHMEYSTAMVMNELVIQNNMDEFQNCSIEWERGQLTEKYMQ